MRDALCQSLLAAAGRQDFVFLTGDLGYKALEPLRAALGERFINAGVAEQNMVGVGAGLARSGLRPWLYSIAPFLYARPYEQIRNDVCLHNLPVVLVGNGGGYGYGVMGATHHALEDYGVLLCLPHMRVYVPVFDSDVPPLIERLFTVDHPAYLRLGVGEQSAGATVPEYTAWRRLTAGGGAVVLAIGPIAGALWAAAEDLDPERRPTVWALGELPIDDFPPRFVDDMKRAQDLLVVEEHVAQGGVGRALAQRLLEHGCAPARFGVRSALGYPSGRYGSQRFHRCESGLDPVTIVRQLSEGRL